MKVAYGKFGRSVRLDARRWGPVGGDNEPLYLLKHLAEAAPDVEWVLFGRNSGEDPQSIGLPPNVTNPWRDLPDEMPFMDMKSPRTKEFFDDYVRRSVELAWPMLEDVDHCVFWLGQHGTSTSALPVVKGEGYTTPLYSTMNYCAFMTHCLNRWTDEDETRDVTWLTADVRNYLKDRSMKWPPRRPVIGQYDLTRLGKYTRYGDERVPTDCGYTGSFSGPDTWHVRVPYAYDQLEVVGIPHDWEPQVPFEERGRFGLVINEARSYVGLDRFSIVRDWVAPLEPDFLVGKWSPESMEKLGHQILPVKHSELPEHLGRVKTTFTTPSSGSGWATTKPWEAFALGAVCFFHPAYDDQGHIIPTREQLARDIVDPELAALAAWLRPRTPDELRRGVEAVCSSKETYEWLRDAQLRLWQRARGEQRAVQEILGRLPGKE